MLDMNVRKILYYGLIYPLLSYGIMGRSEGIHYTNIYPTITVRYVADAMPAGWKQA
jgi:hypothetical protein